ncbi:hypothetical protein [Undibacterium sp.]|uniref:hypothetical protein n=1 Tax=Undibacterium sp. TaxID=1914977 RepID=UPI0025E31998|nr:hypothetical protein [Undibacterium sp.]
MTSFRSAAVQAKHLTIKKASHGKSRHNQNKLSGERKFIASIATEKKYTGCVKVFLEWCILTKKSTSKSQVTACIAEEFLKSKANFCVQKTLDGYRQSISLVFNLQLDYVVSKVDSLLTPRAYSQLQIEHLQKSASAPLSFSIRLAASAGLRVVELDTIALASEAMEDQREWLSERFSGLSNYVEYVVVGKGGLRRKIGIPRSLSVELESYRLPAPTRKTQREIHYTKRYSITGGHSFSQQFSRLSFRDFGWSTGAHGLRHRYAQDRIMQLQTQGFTWDFSLKIVAQEMGHFSTSNTLTYMR